jgi:hypothetical protein
MNEIAEIGQSSKNFRPVNLYPNQYIEPFESKSRVPGKRTKAIFGERV